MQYEQYKATGSIANGALCRLPRLPRRGRVRFAAFVDTLLSAARLIAAPQELGASQELQDKFIRMLRDKGFFQACRRVTVGAHITRWHLCLHAYVHKVGSSLSQWRTS